jgi:hypothetical protein
VPALFYFALLAQPLSYTDIDLGIRGRAIGLLARVLYPTSRLTRRRRRLKRSGEH